MGSGGLSKKVSDLYGTKLTPLKAGMPAPPCTGLKLAWLVLESGRRRVWLLPRETGWEQNVSDLHTQAVSFIV